eukprot:11697-Heterococcus_DN1.PRE.4
MQIAAIGALASLAGVPLRLLHAVQSSGVGMLMQPCLAVAESVVLSDADSATALDCISVLHVILSTPELRAAATSAEARHHNTTTSSIRHCHYDAAVALRTVLAALHRLARTTTISTHSSSLVAETVTLVQALLHDVAQSDSPRRYSAMSAVGASLSSDQSDSPRRFSATSAGGASSPLVALAWSDDDSSVEDEPAELVHQLEDAAEAVSTAADNTRTAAAAATAGAHRAASTGSAVADAVTRTQQRTAATAVAAPVSAVNSPEAISTASNDSAHYDTAAVLSDGVSSTLAVEVTALRREVAECKAQAAAAQLDADAAVAGWQTEVQCSTELRRQLRALQQQQQQHSADADRRSSSVSFSRSVQNGGTATATSAVTQQRLNSVAVTAALSAQADTRSALDRCDQYLVLNQQLALRIDCVHQRSSFSAVSAGRQYYDSLFTYISSSHYKRVLTALRLETQLQALVPHMIDLQQRLAEYETVTSVTSTSSAVSRPPTSASAHYKHASAATNDSSTTAAAAAVNSPHALHSSSSSSSTTGGSRRD